MVLKALCALAESTRFRAMQILSNGQKICIRDLMRRPDATQSRMSRQRAVLKRAGLVVDRRNAQRALRDPAQPAAAPVGATLAKEVMA